MKSAIKKFITPRILELINKPGKFRQKYSSYHDALKLCTTDAYEEKELIEVIFKKTKRFSENLTSEIIPIWETVAYSLLSIINPLIESKDKVIHVLDFGGACGAHYFHLRSLIGKSVKFKWIVVETPMMVRFAKELETDELSFSDNLKDALNKLGTIDLLHTSGTLQYVDSPHKFLDEILNCNAKWVLLNRLGLNKIDRDVITIHSSKLSWNGIGELPEGYVDRRVKYPCTFLTERSFIQKLEQKYLVVAKFNDQSGIYPLGGEEIVGYGLLCKQKTNS